MRGGARAARAAALLGLLLSVAGTWLPAAVPLLPLSGILGPATVLAADDIEVTTSARYTVDPGAGRVRVVVEIQAVNRKPDRATPGGVTRYFYDGVNLGIQPEARNVRATQDGTALRVVLARREGYRLATVLFRDNLYFGQTATVRLAFALPGGRPRSDSDVRVGPAFATFTAWAFGDTGRVRIEVPRGFRVAFAGAQLEAGPDVGGRQAWSARTVDPPGWYAWITATNDAGLAVERLPLAGGQAVVIRGWPEDDRWRSRVRVVLRDGLPALAESIGLPWPVDGDLVVTEVHTPLLEGYAGFYDPSTDEITISEELDDLTIVHEASHAWIDGSLFTERWITEGLADEYAARALRAADRGYPGPDRVTRDAEAAFSLNEWPPPAAIRDAAAAAREAYGYDAAWTAIRRIASRVGEDGMREVFAAAAAGTTAYPGEGRPEDSALPNDWRRFLDLADQAAGPAAEAAEGRSIPELVERWALTPREAALLPARAAAREAYAPLVARGGSWSAPAVVRRALDRWAFAEATAAIEAADAVLATRDGLTTLASTQGVEPAPALEAAYQEAASVAALRDVGDRAARSLGVLGELAAAREVAARPRDWLAAWGMDGLDPDSRLAAAADAWEAGDLAGAAAIADEVARTVSGAPEAGRAKAAIVSFGLVPGAGLLGVALVLARRRRRRRASGRAPGPWA